MSTDDGAAVRWERKEGCTSEHVGDAATSHAGGTDALGRSLYTRTYDDGCRETWRGSSSYAFVQVKGLRDRLAQSEWIVCDEVTRMILQAPSICGVIAPNQGPNGEPLACAYWPGHLPVEHSWAWVPTPKITTDPAPQDGSREDHQ